MRDVDATRASGHGQRLWQLNLLLRLIVLPCSAASIWAIVKSNQVNDTYGELEFSNLTGLKYLVWVNAISAGYALVSAILVYLRLFKFDWPIFLLDQVTAYLMVTSGSAVVEILFLAHEGDKEVSWSEVCSYYGRFCSRTMLSLVFHLVALLCFLALSLVSAFRVFSKYEVPPSAAAAGAASKEVGGDGE